MSEATKQVEDFVDKNFNLHLLPEPPKPPEIPETPQGTAEEDLAIQRRMRERLQRALFRGGRSTTATSPLGIVRPTSRVATRV
jgi:hypothetical protein